MPENAPNETDNTHQLVMTDAAALLQELPIEPGQVKTRRLYSGAGVTVVGVAMDAGAVLAEHSAAPPILVQIAEGRVRFEIAGDEVAMPAGAMIHVAPRVPHSVIAEEPTRFLILMLLGARPARPLGVPLRES